MDKRKEYLISIFVKKATTYQSIIFSINQSFEIFKNSCKYITEEDIKELKEKFTIEEYVKKISPAIDETFSEKELQEIIKFYSSETGSKLFNHIFISKIENSIKDFMIEMESEFIKRNGRNKQNNT